MQLFVPVVVVGVGLPRSLAGHGAAYLREGERAVRQGDRGTEGGRGTKTQGDGGREGDRSTGGRREGAGQRNRGKERGSGTETQGGGGR